MNKEPTEAQQVEFWKRCGFSEVTVRARTLEVVCGKKRSYETCEQRWLRPNCEFEDKFYPSYHSVPFVDWQLPPIDLNNLFRYAVPKLPQDRYYKALSSIFVKQDNPALALFWAIWEVIHNDKTN